MQIQSLNNLFTYWKKNQSQPLSPQKPLEKSILSEDFSDTVSFYASKKKLLRQEIRRHTLQLRREASQLATERHFKSRSSRHFKSPPSPGGHHFTTKTITLAELHAIDPVQWQEVRTGHIKFSQRQGVNPLSEEAFEKMKIHTSEV